MTVLTELPGFSLRHITTGLGPTWPFLELEKGQVTIYHSCQVAIYHSFKALDIAPPGDVLMPAYQCGAEVAAVEAAGFEPVFYPVDVNLNIDPAGIGNRITPRTKALYLTHFFGFPGPAEEIADCARRNSLPLIEDCAPGLFSQKGNRPLGSWGTASVFSLTKSLPVPDGGLLRLNNDKKAYVPELIRPPHKETAQRLKHLMMRGIRRWSGIKEKPGPTEPNELRSRSKGLIPLDIERTSWRASWLTKRVLKKISWREVVSRRRDNYEALLMALDPIFNDRIESLMPTLGEGVSPWVLPIRIHNPLKLKALLKNSGIGAFAVWASFHPRFSSELFPEAARLKRSVLALPVHQELSKSDMALIAQVFVTTVKKQT